MKRGYLYTTFFMLATLVIFSLVFAFKYTKTPPKENFIVHEDSDYVDVMDDKLYTEIQNSWLRDIKEEYSNKSYFYAVTEIRLELN